MMKEVWKSDEVSGGMLEGMRVEFLEEVCEKHGVAKFGPNEEDLIYSIQKHKKPFEFVIGTREHVVPGPVVKPWPRIEVLVGEPFKAEYMKGRAMARIGDKLQWFPYGGDPSKRRHKVDTMSVRLGDGTFEQTPWEDAGYVGDLVCRDGEQVVFPGWGDDYLVIKEGEIHKVRCRVNRVRGGAQHANGLVYSLSYSSSQFNRKKLQRLDVKELVWSEVEVERSYSAGLSFVTVWGAVSALGHVFFIPAHTDRIEFVHRDHPDKLRVLPGKVRGGFKDHGNPRYTHGVFHEKSGKIVVPGRSARGVLLIDPVELSFEEVAMPEELVQAMPTGSFTFDCAIGPDGLVYPAPWADPERMYRFDPVSREFDWIDTTEILGPLRGKKDGEWRRGGNGYCTTAHRIGNEIYFGCGGVRKPLKLVF